MRIGRLRERLRRTSVEPEYYSDYTHHKAFGDEIVVKFCPFDGKAFLGESWLYQHDKMWLGPSASGLIPAAVMEDSLGCCAWCNRNECIREAQRSGKYLYNVVYRNLLQGSIVVSCTYSLEGEWIIDMGRSTLTVLETTRMKVEFKAETREVLLSPGAIVHLTPLTLMQKFAENVCIEETFFDISESALSTFASAKALKKLAARVKIPESTLSILASAKTLQELAARLELKPVRLREELREMLYAIR